MTEALFRPDAYLRTCDANVAAINDRGGIILDRTIFYAASGGQPGDAGMLTTAAGIASPIATTVYDEDRTTIVHVPAENAPMPAVGDRVSLTLDWDQRYKFMRTHTALHLLCSLIPFPVTGGQIGAGEGRLDFDIQDAGALDKATLTASLNDMIAADHPVSDRWITDQDLAANPGLVRTMAVKPPMGMGRVRLVAIGRDGEIDLQPCGGTHVHATGEIGAATVTKIEKKGKQNRRVRIALS